MNVTLVMDLYSTILAAHVNAYLIILYVEILVIKNVNTKANKDYLKIIVLVAVLQDNQFVRHHQHALVLVSPINTMMLIVIVNVSPVTLIAVDLAKCWKVINM